MARSIKGKVKRKIPASELLHEAEKKTKTHPQLASNWILYGRVLNQLSRLNQAAEALEQAINLAPENAESHALMSEVQLRLGHSDEAQAFADKALEIDDQQNTALLVNGIIANERSQGEKALEFYRRIEKVGPPGLPVLQNKASALASLARLDEALEILNDLIKNHPNNYEIRNAAANIRRDMGDFDGLIDDYRKAIELAGSEAIPYSNLLTYIHYDPQWSKEDIYAICLEWQKRYGPASPPVRPVPENKDQNRRLRIGLLSDGFRSHPVGTMTIKAFENLSKNDAELYCYATHLKEDHITKRFKAIALSWKTVKLLSNDDFAKLVRDDQIDILIDLCGHNAGTKAKAIALAPAPLIVKWVGGLINTTGIQAIDYLISDHIETPPGDEDNFYVEKLIRLPNDYIVYEPPAYAPDINPLPAETNKFITFGCFNNPTKINSETLTEWAKLMALLPNSRLLLKGKAYTSESFRERILITLERAGITRDRTILEGPSDHKVLLASYHRVDIALDPYPYSGGLTTCEALYMGVPVVTLPGSTIAGRHSATHLINTGMQELVASSWDDYRKIVLELASDLDSLSTIRKHLRQIVLQSPLCDGPTFAGHLMKSLRAIWQRYCNGKQPAPLTFERNGEQAFFDGETQAIDVKVSPPDITAQDQGFTWSFNGSVVVIDNSSRLLRNPVHRRLLSTKTFSLVSFDPRSLISNAADFEARENIQFVPHALLGDGKPATLYSCLAPEQSSTLRPYPAERLPKDLQQSTQVLAELPISTVALDSIEGLKKVDLLILDELCDISKILEHGKETLKNTLAIEVAIALQATHEHQNTLDEISYWAHHNNFRFYCFTNTANRTHFPLDKEIKHGQSSELVRVHALFIPSKTIIESLDNNQKTKLAFILHTIYGIKDYTYKLLTEVNQTLANHYLASEGILGGASQSKLPTGFANSTIINQIAEKKSTLPVDSEIRLEGFPLQKTPHRTQETNLQTKSNVSLKYNDVWNLDHPIDVIDIGANPIDGIPPYAELLKKGKINLVGFEPQKKAYDTLQLKKGKHETYLPHAVGTGDKTKLFLCQAPGMTSTLKPNNAVLNHFQGYPIWGKVTGIEEIDTVRLDDIDIIKNIDWLKIDIQGGELNVFTNGEKKLKNSLVIQTEVNFIQLYENQPLFAEIDQWMRSHGFTLHTLLEQRRRLYAPMKINGGIHNGINQLTTADAVYIPSFDRLSTLESSDLAKLCSILHSAYRSYDLVLKLLNMIDEKEQSNQSAKYLEILASNKNNKVSFSTTTSEENPHQQKKKRSHPSGKIEDKTIFVVGCGHSGTTLMASILGAHPEIHTIYRETNWFYGKAQDIDNNYYREKEKSLLEGRRIICEKTPKHILKIDEIRHKFPNAAIIAMTRDSKDVIASLKNRTGLFEQSLIRWITDNQALHAHLSDNNLLKVHYEDLVVSSKLTMKKILTFLQLPYTDSIFDFYKKEQNWFGVKNPSPTDGKGESNHVTNRAWQMTQPIHDKRGIWKEFLTKEEAEIVDNKTASLMNLLGYY